MKKFLILSFLHLIYLSAGSQHLSQFRSVQSGSWSDPAIWEILISNSWQPASAIPDSLSGEVIIQPGDTIAISARVTGRNLNLSGVLRLAFSSELGLYGQDNIIRNGGVLINSGGRLNSEHLLQFFSGARYLHQFDQTEGAIPLANWDSESTIEICGFTSQIAATPDGNWNQSFGNVIWNTPKLASDFNLNGLLNNINGTFTIKNTNNRVLRLTDNQTVRLDIQDNFQILDSARFSISRSGPNGSHVTINVGGDFIFQSVAPLGSRICEQGTSVVNVNGNFLMDRGTLFFSSGSGGTSSAGADLKVMGDVLFNGGTIDASVANSNRVGDLFFKGTTEQKFISKGNVIGSFNYRLTKDSKVILPDGNRMTGSSFECDGCTFITESIDPAGAIQKSATGGGSIRVRNQFWNVGSIIIYRGSIRQFLSSDHPQQAGITTVIDNSAGTETSASGSGVVIGGNLEVLRGGLIVAKNNLTVRGNLNTYGGPVALSSVGLSSARTLTIDGELLLTGPGERLKVESSASTNAANAVLVFNGNLGGTGSVGFYGPNAQLQIGGVARVLRRPLPVTQSFQLEQLTMNSPGTTLTISQPLSLGNYTASSNSWTGGLNLLAGTVKMNASLVVRTVAGLLGGALDFSGQSVELQRNIQTNWPIGGFAGNRNSVMKVTSNFAGIDNVIAFVPEKDTVGSLILDRSANVQAIGGLPVTPHIKINSPLTVSKLLELKDGELYHQSGLNLLAGATIIRTPDAAFSASTILSPAGGPYRLVYKDGLMPASLDAGVEALGELTTFITELTNQLTVRSTIEVRDSLTVARGQLTLATDTLATGRIDLWGLLNVAPGATLNAGNGQLSLRSNSIRVGGRVGILESNAMINGDIRIENFMPGKGYGFRYISAPAQNMRFTDVRDDLDFHAGYLYQYNEEWTGQKDYGWSRNLNLESILNPGKGYLILPQSGYEYSNNIWDVTGPLVRGPVQMPVTYTPSSPSSYPDDGWNLLGNPYASPIYWSLDKSQWSDGQGGSMVNVDPFIWVRDLSGNNRSWNAETGIGDLSEGTGIIPTGSAFWVHTYGPQPKLVLHEQAKAASGGIFYRKAEEVLAGMKIGVVQGDRSASCFLLRRRDTRSAYDRGKDAPLLMDSVFSVGLLSADDIPLVHYSAETLPDEIALYFSNSNGEHLKIDVEGVKDKANIPLWLKDLNTGKVFDLEQEGLIELVSENERYVLLTQRPTEKSLPDQNPEKRIFIIPNPIDNGQLRILAAPGEITRIQIIDITGRLLNEIKEFESDYEFTTCSIDLSPGLYIAIIHSKENIFRERFRVEP